MTEKNINSVEWLSEWLSVNDLVIGYGLLVIVWLWVICYRAINLNIIHRNPVRGYILIANVLRITLQNPVWVPSPSAASRILYGPPTDPVRPFFSSSSVVLQCGTEILLKNY